MTGGKIEFRWNRGSRRFSLVIALEEPVIVDDVYNHPAHSPAVDLTIRRTTRRLVAVPFRFAGAVRGVVTAVTFAPDSPPFSPDASKALQSIATVLGRLTESTLLARPLE